VSLACSDLCNSAFRCLARRRLLRSLPTIVGESLEGFDSIDNRRASDWSAPCAWMHHDRATPQTCNPQTSNSPKVRHSNPSTCKHRRCREGKSRRQPLNASVWFSSLAVAVGDVVGEFAKRAYGFRKKTGCGHGGEGLRAELINIVGYSLSCASIYEDLLNGADLLV
jgi:hypothetical protein